jgi:hypothetical protein
VEHAVAKAIMMVAETLLAAIVLMLIFTTYRSNQLLDQSRTTQNEQMQIEQLHDELMQYSGTTMLGNDVRNLIRNYRGSFVCITVDNGITEQSYNYEDDLLTDYQSDEDFSSLMNLAKLYGTDTYIDPLWQFHCSVYEDEQTGDILELYFTKEEAVLE